ncbi:MAG: phosphocholine cytidylyltransferase family protein, partial [Gammaproteobacteria bacterium]
LGERPIIEEMIGLLADLDFERIIIVTGHLAHFYAGLSEVYGSLIETVHNPHYANSGSMYSLYCARNHVDSDFLLLESDLVFERRALTACRDLARDNVVLMSGRTNAGDEVYVETRGGLLVAMSKDRDELGTEVAGELVGICKISLPLFQGMCEEAEAGFTTTLKVCYETDCLVAVASRHPIHCHLVEDLAWSEIDYEMHLHNAQENVYPEILRRDGARRPPLKHRRRLKTGKLGG